MMRVSLCVPPEPGDDAELDLRLTEFRRVGGDDHVAHQGQFAAAPQSKSGDRRDHRFADARQPFPLTNEIFEIGLDECLRLHFFDVGARGESFGRTGENKGADPRIIFKNVECSIEFMDQGQAQRIQGLRPVETDQTDFSMRLDFDVFIGHGAASPDCLCVMVTRSRTPPKDRGCETRFILYGGAWTHSDRGV